MSRPRKTPDPVPGNNGEALERIIAYVKAEYPEQWEAMRLYPLQHGLEDLVGLLK